MGYTHGEHRGDVPRPRWLARFTHRRLPHGGREGGAGRGAPVPAHGTGGVGSARSAGGGLPQGGRPVGFSEREWQWLRFLRWLYLHGQLTDHPRR